MGTFRPQEITSTRLASLKQNAYDLAEALPCVIPGPDEKIKVQLFRESGKYYCTDEWTVPGGNTALGPSIMAMSPDFRRIDNGKVLIPEQYWGYPQLL